MNNLLENASNYILENNKNVPSISEILNEALELLYEDKIPSVLLQAYKKAAGNPFNKNLENPVRISGHLDLLQKYSAFHQDTDRKTYAFDFGKATYEFKSKLEAINDLGLTNSILLDKRPINNINDILSLRQFSFKAGAGRTNIISINKNAINGDSLKENISKYRFIYSDSGLNEIHYNADTDAFFIAARCNIPANAFNDKQVEQDAIVTQGRLEFIISGDGKPGNINDGAKAALIAILFSETIIKTDDNEHPLMSKTFNIHSLKNQKQKALDTLTQNVDLKSFPVSMSTILNAFNYIIKTQIYSSTLKLILDSGKLNTLSRDDAI